MASIQYLVPAVSINRGLESIGVAGLGQEFFGPFRIIGIRFDIGIPAHAVGRNYLSIRFSSSKEYLIADALAVNGQAGRFPDPDIQEGAFFVGEGEISSNPGSDR